MKAKQILERMDKIVINIDKVSFILKDIKSYTGEKLSIAKLANGKFAVGRKETLKESIGKSIQNFSVMIFNTLKEAETKGVKFIIPKG